MGNWDFFEDGGVVVRVRVVASRKPRRAGRKASRRALAEERSGERSRECWCSACGLAAVAVLGVLRCPGGCGEGSEEFGGAQFVASAAQASAIRGEYHPILPSSPEHGCNCNCPSCAG